MLSHGHWDHAGGLTKAFDLIVKAKGFHHTDDYDQLTNYLEKIGHFSNPPKESCNNFFWDAQDLILVQLILIMQKITKKSLYPPKMYYSALQCSAMY